MLLSAKLLPTIDLIENSSFEEALQEVDYLLKQDNTNFWAWYLGALALGYLKDDASFLYYLKKCKSLLPSSPYCKLLSAYAYLIEERDDLAIIEWTELLEGSHDWFARRLIESIRKESSLQEAANQRDIGRFVLLPDRNLIEPSPENTLNKQKSIFLISIYKKITLLFKIMAIVIGIFILSSVAVYLFTLPIWENLFVFNTTNDNKNIAEWNQFSITPSLQNLTQSNTQDILYEYAKKEYIIDDFEKAKYAINQKRINTARYLLQRIIYSNADFGTKEKCKIFIGFIPDISKDEVSDFVPIHLVLKEPEFYFGIYVFQEVTVVSEKDTPDSKQLQAIIKSGDDEYLAEIFFKKAKKDSSWKPYNEFKQTETTEDKVKKAMIFGQFKGLVGPQKKIYIESYQLWY